jgi:hypothetical protein
MTYSWILLVALIGVVADRTARLPGSGVPALGRGAWALLALLAVASVGSKASSVPVVAGALAFLAVVQLLRQRRCRRATLLALGITIAAQLFGNAVLFAFETHGMTIRPFWGPDRFYPAGGGALAVGGIILAYLANMLLRLAGLPVLLRERSRGSGWRGLGDTELLLAGGTLAGIAAYLIFAHPGDGNQYFVRAGWMFGVLASGWGAVLLADRARLSPATGASPRARWAVGAGAGAFAAALIGWQLRFAGPLDPAGGPWAPLRPILIWFAALAASAAIAAVAWRLLGAAWPSLRGRGGAVLLTAVLLVGAPGLVMEAKTPVTHPNGGGYVPVALPAWRVAAARWLREHSSPDDVVAVNTHCITETRGKCDARSFWVSAYAERRVLVEGWAFTPRATAAGAFKDGVLVDFWDPQLLALNDAAFATPTAATLARLRDEYGVRWLLADRTSTDGPESEVLASLASTVFKNGRVTIYDLRAR